MARRDLELVLAWRSNPKIFRYFRHQDEPLVWHDHVDWYESREPDRHDFIVHFECRCVGVVGIDSADEVTVYLGDFEARGKGVATMALRWLCERFLDRVPLYAEVHKDNAPAKRLFEQRGFQKSGDQQEWVRYIYDP